MAHMKSASIFVTYFRLGIQVAVFEWGSSCPGGLAKVRAGMHNPTPFSLDPGESERLSEHLMNMH